MKITLGKLAERGDELAEFLGNRLKQKLAVESDTINISDEKVKPKLVKTYIKRYLFIKGLRKDYRVLVNKDQLTIQKLEQEEVTEESSS